jgi:hypothetical protein
MLRTVPALLCTAAVLAVPAASLAKGPLPEPDAGPDPRGLTISGVGVVRVKPPARLSQASIEGAVALAERVAARQAVEQARTRATGLAAAAGLTLGAVQVVTRHDAEVDLGYQTTSERYCRPRREGGPRCQAPALASANVTVTFATAQTSAAVPADRAVVGSAAATAAVSPRDRRSSASIRQAILAARLAAGPDALAAARTSAGDVASAAGMQLGALFSIAEVRRPFDELAQSSFGPGRFCGTVRRTITRRNPATGRREAVRRVSERRCFFGTETEVALRVTYLPR